MQADGGAGVEGGHGDHDGAVPAPLPSAGSSVLGAQRRLLRLLTLLAVVLLVGSVAWFSWHEREQELEAATAQSVRRTARLAETLSQTLQLAQVTIDQADARLRRLPPGASLSGVLGEAPAERAQLLAALPLPFEVHALDREGRALDLAPGSGGHAHDGGAAPGLVHGGIVSLPVAAASAAAVRWQVGTTTGTPDARAVPLRRAAAPNAHGVAAYAVDLSHAALVRHFDGERLQPGGGVVLFRAEADGSITVLARSPHNEGELGQRLRGPLAEALARAPAGVFSALTQIDQVHRLVAYQRLDGDAADLVVANGTSTDAVLDGWHRSLPWSAAITLLLAGGMLWGGWRLDRSLRALAANQRALEHSENHFRALAGNLPDVVVRMDRSGRHHYANAAVREATGLAPADFIGKTNAELGMPAANVAAWMATLARVFDSGQAERLEFAYPGPRGLRHWESIVTLEPAVGRAEPMALVISRDITERRQVEQARAALHQRLADVLESMSDGFVSLDRDWRYVAVNRKAGEMLGRDAASLVGQHIWTEFPEGVGQPFHRAYERAMNDGATIVMEEYYPPWDRWFENRIYPSADGIAIFFTDITERRRAFEALQDSEHRLREAQQLAAIGSWELDLRSGALRWSDEVFRIFEIDPARFGASYEAFLAAIHPDDRDAVDRAFRQSVTERGAYAITHRLRFGDGRIKHVHEQGRSFHAEDGTPLRSVGTVQDVSARVQAEQALRDGEERLRLALQAANQGLYDLDLLTGEAVVSPEYARMLGYEPEDFHETHAAWRDRLHPDDREAVHRVFEDYVAGRRDDYRVEFRQRLRDGGWKWILSVGRIQERDAEGRPLRMLGTHTDIDAGKQAQAALAASQARMGYLMGKAPTVIYTARPEGDYAATYYSPTVRDMLGWSPEQFVGDPAFWLDHVHPDDRDRVLRELQALDSLDEAMLEYRFRHADGSWRWMRDAVSMQRDADGRPLELVGSWIDITERREAEDAVRRLAAELERRVQERTAQLAVSEARYRTIFEAVPVAIGEEDWSDVQKLLRELRARGITDGASHFADHPEFVQQCLDAVRVVRLNRKALALHDAHDKDRELPDLKAFYPSPDDLPQFVGELEAMWQGRRLYTGKKSLPAVSGRMLNLMVSISLPALDDADGTALTCMVDITEIDRLNAELDRSLARLRQVNKELETFTYSVSHDLKAPLRGIDGYSRLLLTDHQDRLDEEGRQFLAHIRRATQHMGVLIDDLLSYSRLERQELTLTALALDALVDGVLAAYRNDLAAQGVELRVAVPQGLRALGDAQGLTIALRNLVDNAIKFSGDRRPPRIEITASRTGDAVRLTVRDNGLGFDMKFHDRIFSIFQRLHRAEDYPGTGVGLAIVRKAMERMGGRVWAESAPGHGATFHIELPEAA